MLSDPGHIAANAAATGAKPCYKAEIMWDEAWVDESERLLPGFSCQNQIVDPFEGLVSMGSAPIGRTESLRFDNYDGRYSRDKSGSVANIYGIYGKKIRLSAGYIHNGTPEYVRIFTGRIMDPVASERSAIIILNCHDMGSIPLQQKCSTIMYENRRTDQWIQTLAGLAGVSSYSLERGLITIPYCYLDDDFAMDEIRRAANAESGVAFHDVNGVLRFWNAAHWCNATSVATFTVADFSELGTQHSYNDIYNVIAVEYQPREPGQVATVYELKRTVVVPPGGSKTLKLKFRYPILAYSNYSLRACSGGGEDLTSQVTLTDVFPDAAASWNVEINNTNTRHAAFVTKFEVYGVPIEGRPAEEHEVDESGSDVKRRKDIRGNWYIQTEAQARLIGAILSQRFKDVRLSMTLKGVPANPLLELGDVITVTATRTGVNKQGIITSIKNSCGSSFTMDIGWSDFTDFYEYSGYSVVGSSPLGASGGRLFV